LQVDLMTSAAPLRQVQTLAREAARAGFSGLLVTEAGRTAYLTCAAAALAADLELSTGVAVAFPRSPMVTAQAAWELAETTNGRFRLGLGTQVRAHIERRYSADFDRPGPRLREYVLAVQAIFRAFGGAEKLAFEGDFYRFSLLPGQWAPGAIGVPAPPIDVAAVNPWMLRMAGEVADGVHVHPLNTSTYLQETVRPNVAAGAAKSGRSLEDIRLIVPVFTAVGDTEEERREWREMARMQVSFYGSTPNYRFIFEQVGRPDLTDRIRERQKAGDFAGMAAAVDDEVLNHFVVTGSWQEMPDLLVERYSGTADRIVLYFAGMAWQRNPASLKSWGDVATAVREATGAAATSTGGAA
jgi:probable F420-dependent oxidoreductase